MSLPAALVGRRGSPVDRFYLPRAYDFTFGQGRRLAGCVVHFPLHPRGGAMKESLSINPALPRASHRVQLTTLPSENLMSNGPITKQ
jgi:hypothetical protein